MNTDKLFLAGGYGGTSPIQSFVCLPLIDHEWSSMDVTKTHKKSRKLSLKQRNAVDLLVQGRTDQEVANLLQIRRETVNRWKNSCPFFRSALNKKRKEVWENAHMRLRSLITNATDSLEQKIDQGSWRAAVELLKILGLKGKVPPPSEAVDPLLVLLEQ